jgi:hypothetical protein
MLASMNLWPRSYPSIQILELNSHVDSTLAIGEKRHYLGPAVLKRLLFTLRY